MNKKYEIVVITHGLFGQELVNSQKLITGEENGIKAFSLLAEMSIEDLYLQVDGYISKIKTPLIVLTDLVGGTPNNLAKQLSNKYDFTTVSGVNLPVLIELVVSRDNDNITYEEVINSAIQFGIGSIRKQVNAEIDTDNVF